MNELLLLFAAAFMIICGIYAGHQGLELRRINKILTKCVQDIQDEIDNGEWKPINTSPMNLEVLISDGQYVYSAICDYRGGEPNEDWTVGFPWRGPVINKPTHWMPMPEASK